VVVIQTPQTQKLGVRAAPLIVVNEGNRSRSTPSGRVQLANGYPNQAYNIVSEAQMEEILTGIANYGFDEHSRPFQPGDEGWLTGRLDPEVKGVVMVEDGETRRVLIARRPQADPTWAAAYQCFADVKAIVYGTGRGRTEVPASSHVLQ
jgi:hypothetical protein